jgi:hypothetical protein
MFWTTSVSFSARFLQSSAFINAKLKFAGSEFHKLTRHVALSLPLPYVILVMLLLTLSAKH